MSCLWVAPGSHKAGKIDIEKLIEADGSEQLEGAVPLHAKAGDVTIVNRQALHCSFANVSQDQRISLTFGFHRRNSVLGAQGALSESTNVVYDEKRIDERSQVIGVAIDARAQYYPEEHATTISRWRAESRNSRLIQQTGKKSLRTITLKIFLSRKYEVISSVAQVLTHWVTA